MFGPRIALVVAARGTPVPRIVTRLFRALFLLVLALLALFVGLVALMLVQAFL